MPVLDVITTAFIFWIGSVTVATNKYHSCEFLLGTLILINAWYRLRLRAAGDLRVAQMKLADLAQANLVLSTRKQLDELRQVIEDSESKEHNPLNLEDGDEGDSESDANSSCSESFIVTMDHVKAAGCKVTNTIDIDTHTLHVSVTWTSTETPTTVHITPFTLSSALELGFDFEPVYCTTTTDTQAANAEFTWPMGVELDSSAVDSKVEFLPPVGTCNHEPSARTRHT